MPPFICALPPRELDQLGPSGLGSGHSIPKSPARGTVMTVGVGDTSVMNSNESRPVAAFKSGELTPRSV